MTNEQGPLPPPQEEPESGAPQEQPEPSLPQDLPEPAPPPEQPEPEEPTLAQDLAELVRERTRSQAKLTPLAKLEMEGELLTREQQEELVAAVQTDETCLDIRVLRTSSGAVFLYSSEHMSNSYAQILLRVEDGNPYEQIAAPVREHSKIYPRPTSLEELKDPAYGIDPDRLLDTLDEMAQMDQYSDIKLIRASTGALYLHSDRYMSKAHAESLVQWEEVDRYDSM